MSRFRLSKGGSVWTTSSKLRGGLSEGLENCQLSVLSMHPISPCLLGTGEAPFDKDVRRRFFPLPDAALRTDKLSAAETASSVDDTFRQLKRISAAEMISSRRSSSGLEETSWWLADRFRACPLVA